MDRGLHICLPVSPDCVNPDSYGLICVRCGACGRELDGAEENKAGEIEAETRRAEGAAD